MTSLNNDPSKELAEDLAKSLQVTTTLIQDLLGEIRDNATSLAVLKERLTSLSDKVNFIYSAINMDDPTGAGSITTRVTISEKYIKDLEAEVSDVESTIESIKILMSSDKKELYNKIEKTKNELKNMFGLVEKTEAQQNKEITIQRLKTAGVMLPGVISLILLIAKAMGYDMPFSTN